MQIKDKIIVCVVLIFFTLNLNLFAEEFNISASEITIDKGKNTVVGRGSVEVTDKEGTLIKGNKIIYLFKLYFFLVMKDFQILSFSSYRLNKIFFLL